MPRVLIPGTGATVGGAHASTHADGGTDALTLEDIADLTGAAVGKVLKVTQVSPTLIKLGDDDVGSGSVPNGVSGGDFLVWDPAANGGAGGWVAREMTIHRIWLPPYDAPVDSGNAAPALRQAAAAADPDRGAVIVGGAGHRYQITDSETNDDNDPVGVAFQGPNIYLTTEGVNYGARGALQSGGIGQENHGAQASFAYVSGTAIDTLFQFEDDAGSTQVEHRGGAVIGIECGAGSNRGNLDRFIDARNLNRFSVFSSLFGVLEAAGAFAVRIREAGSQTGGGQATQYGRIAGNAFWCHRGAVQLVAESPDYHVYDNYIENQRDTVAYADTIGIQYAGHAVKIYDNEILFMNIGILGDGLNGSGGGGIRHSDIRRNHIEGHQNATSGTYAAAIRLINAVANANPYIFNNEFGNPNTFVDLGDVDNTINTLFFSRSNRRRGGTTAATAWMNPSTAAQVTVPTGTVYENLSTV